MALPSRMMPKLTLSPTFLAWILATISELLVMAAPSMEVTTSYFFRPLLKAGVPMTTSCT
ncbi:hypothetical protein D3C75_983090 [compost metagenome]